MNPSEEIENDFGKARKLEEELNYYIKKVKENPLCLSTSVLLFNLGRSQI
jgi:hypothetical protein